MWQIISSGVGFGTMQLEIGGEKYNRKGWLESEKRRMKVGEEWEE